MTDATTNQASIMDSIEAYATRLARADRLGLPGGGLGAEVERAHDHWRRLLTRSDAADLRDRYQAAYRSARWEEPSERRSAQAQKVDARFLSTAPQPWRAEAARVPASAPPSAAASSSAVSPASAPPSAAASAPASTVSFETEDTVDTVSATPYVLPFRAAGHPMLSIEQHTACCAELACWPAASATTLARYGLAEEGRRAAEFCYWAAARKADPAVNAKWESLYSAYTRYYARR
jgi:hypothetical protein